ncbi:MAG: UDP-N-acetylenolpyruvoylglucosamine reductase [Aquificota bacterium]|nr:MAG: UDP-N-acetylenolpyruvoylglucosamine reductase [Aquificota bacterium]
MGLLSAFALRGGFAGLDPLAGIPGTLGGALVMNAGAFGRTLGDLVEEVEVLVDGKVEVLRGVEVDWGYRTSSLKGSTVVGATLKLVPGDGGKIREDMVRFARLRRQKQPLDFPSAGSVFKNPPGHSAGRLIDEAGLKGARVGDAMVSPLHANFIVNLGQARARDVRLLVEVVKERVRERFSISLEEEIVYAGVFEFGEDEDCAAAGGAFL